MSDTSSTPPATPPVKQANQRGAARLAAVQALYQMDIGGTGVLKSLPNTRHTGLVRNSMAKPI